MQVIPRAPAQPAPKTIPTAANSSSACITAQVVLPSLSVLNLGTYASIASATEDEGVIGYQDSILIPP